MSPTHTNLCSWGPWSEACPLQASFLGGGGGGNPARSSYSCGPVGLTPPASPGPSLCCQPCLPCPCGAHCTHRALSCLQRTHRGFTFLGEGGGGWGRAGMTVAEEGRREEAEKQRVI